MFSLFCKSCDSTRLNPRVTLSSAGRWLNFASFQPRGVVIEQYLEQLVVPCLFGKNIWARGIGRKKEIRNRVSAISLQWPPMLLF